MVHTRTPIAIALAMVCEHTYKAMVCVHTIEAVEAEHSKGM